MSENVMIKVDHLSKDYGASRPAVDDISFHVRRGEVLGFLGPNGAGKTTTMKMLTSYLAPTSGKAEVAGHDVYADSLEVRRRIGYLPEDTPLYKDMSVLEYLEFICDVRGVSKDSRPGRLRKVADQCGIGDRLGSLIGELSKGFRQRVGLAQAIVHEPKFLILDEPTRGLDPVQIVEMRNLIHDLKQNHTVLISSHILTEISQTCDRLLVLGKGKILGSGSEGDLAKHEGEIRQITVTVRLPSGDDGKGQIAKVLNSVDGVSKVADPYEQGGGMSFALSTTKDCRADVSRSVVEAKLDLIKLDYARSELENTFIRLVGGSDASN
jgi:ABC-2 type transport system ATP-binding protein